MPRVDPAGRTRAGPQEAGGSNGREERIRLLRSSHIVAALVREVLDGQALRETSPHPLTPTQLQLLRLVASGGGRRIGEVAAFLGLSPSAATENVDKLEGRGLLLRRPAPGDRRGVRLSPSLEGALLVRRLEARQAELLAPVVAGLPRSRLGALNRLLEGLSLRLLAGSGETGGPCLRCAGFFDPQCPLLGLVADCPCRPGAGPRSGPGAEAQGLREVS